MSKLFRIYALMGFLLVIALPSYAQQSMNETEKLRLKEEKRRYKLKKKTQKEERKGDKSSGKGKKKKLKSKDKAQITKAAQGLSGEGLKVSRTRAKNRKGAQKLTKVAKAQRKSEKRRLRSLRR